MNFFLWKFHEFNLVSNLIFPLISKLPAFKFFIRMFPTPGVANKVSARLMYIY